MEFRRKQQLPELVAGELVPFTGSPDQVLRDLVEAHADGRVQRVHGVPIQHDDGQLTVFVTPVPAANASDSSAGRKRWEPYLLALGVVVGTACLAVVLVLVVVALHAVVLWGIDHAVEIGIGLVIAFVALLMGAGAVAKMRFGTPGRRH